MPGDPDTVNMLAKTSHFVIAKPFGIQKMLDALAKARACHFAHLIHRMAGIRWRM